MPCSGRMRARQRVVLRAADGAQQHRVGALRERERGSAAADARPRRSRRRRSAPSSVSIGRPSRAQRVEHLDACATISGPMPSPGRTAIFIECSRCSVRKRRRIAAPRSASRLRRARAARRSRFASNARISSACCSVRPMSSRPFSRQCLRNGSMSKWNAIAPSGVATVCRSRSIVSLKPGNAATSSNSRSTSTSGSTIGSRPFLKQLLKKMSAYDGAITARKP